MTIIVRDQTLDALRKAYYLICGIGEPTPFDRELASRILFCINSLEAVKAGGW